VLAITHLQQGWMTGQICSDMTLFLPCDFPKCKVSQEHKYCIIAEVTIWTKYDAQNYSLGSKLEGSHCKSKSFRTKEITLVVVTFFCWIGISCCFLHSFTQTQFFKLCISIKHLSEVSHCGHCLNSLFINVSGL